MFANCFGSCEERFLNQLKLEENIKKLLNRGEKLKNLRLRLGDSPCR